MPKSGLKHIDVGAELTKTEWESEDSHELLHGTSFPSSPVERQLFYRDDEHKWYIYDGSAWVWLGGGGGGMSVHGNEYHDPDFAESSHTHSDLSPAHKDVATGVHGVGGSIVESAAGSQAKVDAHKDLTTGVHGVGAGTIAKVGDIAVDSNLSAAAQEAVTKRHDRQHAITSTADHTSAATAGKILKADANGLPVNATNTDTEVADAVDKKHSKVITITFIIDGAGSAITTGQKGHLEIPFACTITGWTLLADQSGSIVIDVWRDTYANFPPTVADTIAGSEKPTLSSQQKNQDLSLTTWTTTVAAGDILAFNVDSASTVTRVTLSIRATKT